MSRLQTTESGETVSLRFVDHRRPPPGDTWGTPRHIFNELHCEFGFTVDAAALPRNRKLERYWSPKDDGLRQPWRGERVWCNPPYSNLMPWIRKGAAREADVSVFLLPVRPGTDWFLEHVWDNGASRTRDGVEIRFCRNRIKFEGASYHPAWDSMVIVFRSI